MANEPKLTAMMKDIKAEEVTPFSKEELETFRQLSEKLQLVLDKIDHLGLFIQNIF